MSTEKMLKASALPYEAPDFPVYDEDAYLEAVKEGIKRAKKNLEVIKNNPEAPDFDNTILALELADEEKSRVLSIFYNLYSAHTNEKLQALSEEIGPLSAAFANDILLDEDLFHRVDAVYQQRDRLDLTQEQKTVLENTWLGFVRNGAKLSTEDKKILREIDAEMAKIGPKFSKNVLDATNAYELVIEDEADLSGLPDSAIAAAAEDAEGKGYSGRWRFSLDMPSFIGFMTYADNRDLREAMWRANANKAFGGEFDNAGIVKKIVELRHKRARLLGYETHADFVLERRMAKDTKTVMDFIDRIAQKAKPKAQKDLKELKEFAHKAGFKGDLKPWDILYWSEKLKKAAYDFDEEALRPYFSLDNVIKGMFLHAEKLYGLSFKEVTDKYPVYQDDVRVFEITDKESGAFKALYYLDLFPRESKRGGAWMNTFRSQGLEGGKIKRPTVVNVCNFTKPTKDKPSLLTHREVETLFHEFGHGLHAILSDVTYASVSGPHVLWDFVELPSQMNEQWTLEAETLNTFAKHYETGEKIPAALIDKLRKAQSFMSGWQVLRQMTFSKLDMVWHTADPMRIKDVEDFENEAIKDLSLLPYEGGNFSVAFSHIFAGGYSAGYYSYMWAEVLDADAFEAFQENGLYDAQTAKRFKELLAAGGSEDPSILYRKFRGRDPKEDALLRRKGLFDKTPDSVLELKKN